MGKAEIEAYLMWLEINESDPLIQRKSKGLRAFCAVPLDCLVRPHFGLPQLVPLSIQVFQYAHQPMR